MQLFGSTKYTLMLHTIFENGCYARSQVYPGHYVFRFFKKKISQKTTKTDFLRNCLMKF